MLMEMAHVTAKRSTCNRLQVGAIVARDGRVLMTGYNGPASGLPHCQHSASDGPCEDAVHAEANAIAFAARHGVAVDGAEMFVTHSPCIHCAKLLVNSGLRCVYFDKLFRDPAGVVLLMRAGVRCLSALGEELAWRVEGA